MKNLHNKLNNKLVLKAQTMSKNNHFLTITVFIKSMMTTRNLHLDKKLNILKVITIFKKLITLSLLVLRCVLPHQETVNLKYSTKMLKTILNKKKVKFMRNISRILPVFTATTSTFNLKKKSCL